MGWPELTLLALWLLGLGMHLARDGDPILMKDGSPAKYSFWVQAFRLSIWTALLWSGGFFD